MIPFIRPVTGTQGLQPLAMVFACKLPRQVAPVNQTPSPTNLEKISRIVDQLHSDSRRRQLDLRLANPTDLEGFNLVTQRQAKGKGRVELGDLPESYMYFSPQGRYLQL